MIVGIGVRLLTPDTTNGARSGLHIDPPACGEWGVRVQLNISEKKRVAERTGVVE